MITKIFGSLKKRTWYREIRIPTNLKVMPFIKITQMILRCSSFSFNPKKLKNDVEKSSEFFLALNLHKRCSRYRNNPVSLRLDTVDYRRNINAQLVHKTFNGFWLMVWKRALNGVQLVEALKPLSFVHVLQIKIETRSTNKLCVLTSHLGKIFLTSSDSFNLIDVKMKEATNAGKTFIMQISRFSQKINTYFITFLSRNSFIMQFMCCLQAFA